MNKNVFDMLSKHIKKHFSGTNKNILAELNDRITFVFVDDIYVNRCLEIISYYESFGITNIKWFTSRNIDSKYICKIDPITSKEEYSSFILKKLNSHITTEFIIISQWDGFILNPAAWTDRFFDYDYIGAPWWFDKSTVGGNGGFSLRSKKLMNLLENIPHNGIDPEDLHICKTHADRLIKDDIQFAPPGLAKTFSVESEQYTESFGFHSYLTQNIERARHIYKQKFYHSGDLGDIIYSLPFIKQKGGGVLILSPDYKKMDVRSPMTIEKSREINRLLINQPYIIDVLCFPTKPSDIDYDLNDFRKSFIDWGAGTLSQDEIKEVQSMKLTQLYIKNIDPSIPVNYDEDPWLFFDKSIQLSSKPIVVNRSARYHHNKFPWKDIIKTFGPQMVFVGLREEYNSFVKECGYIQYYQTPTYLTLAEVINGAKLFIGNQSFAYSLAEGMKKNCLQETSYDLVPNCMFVRDNCFLTNGEDKADFSKIKEFIIKSII
jgi:hypothetical protein